MNIIDFVIKIRFCENLFYKITAIWPLSGGSLMLNHHYFYSRSAADAN